MRIITTTCSNTEIVDALGCAAHLVAVDDHSDYPPKVVNRLPRVGPDLSIDVQAVVDLKPDLVLASLTVPGHEKVVESLRDAGLNVFAPETIGLDHVYRDISDIAELLEVQHRGDELIDHMQQQMHPQHNDGYAPTLTVQWWPKPVIAAGKRSWVHDLIELTGAGHAMAELNERSAPLEDNDAMLQSADAWIISWCGVELDKYRPEVLYRRESLAQCKAIQNRAVYCVSEAFLGRPSPRLVDGYQQLLAITRKLQSDNTSKSL